MTIDIAVIGLTHSHIYGQVDCLLREGARLVGFWSDEDLKGAVAIFDDPADLAANLDRSPLALDRDSMPPPSPVRIRVKTAAATSSR